MKLALLLCLPLIAGCAVFRVKQEDISREDEHGKTIREIVTHVTGYSLFSSAQTLTAIKALQTEKTQSFGAGTFGQQGATNSLEALNALARIAEAVRPTP